MVDIVYRIYSHVHLGINFRGFVRVFICCNTYIDNLQSEYAIFVQQRFKQIEISLVGND